MRAGAGYGELQWSRRQIGGIVFEGRSGVVREDEIEGFRVLKIVREVEREDSSARAGS